MFWSWLKMGWENQRDDEKPDLLAFSLAPLSPSPSSSSSAASESASEPLSASLTSFMSAVMSGTKASRSSSSPPRRRLRFFSLAVAPVLSR